ncbi:MULTISPECIES: hypothetical protein [Gracilibacillus]|uniref:hypothetical protein n=1 Tax=Gracilibacillus TaxID=74385 RepID=UPI000826C417|nr:MULTISPECIES: hypothetical protein [Gracilibacillus]
MDTNTPVKRSAKAVREDLHGRELRAISKQIDITKLNDQEVLPVDSLGNVDIQPDHPDYKYWTEDD